MTVYAGPGASGSDIPNIMCYFNGVEMLQFIGIRTFQVKIIGTSPEVAASLAIGKEGILVHIDAIIRHLIAYLLFKFNKYF